MHMRQAGVIVMLVVAALWAAAPAFACLLPASPHACCKSMPECNPAVMGADSSCCQVQAPENNGVPAGQLDAQSAPAHATVLVSVVVRQVSAGLHILSPASFPSSGPPRTLSILRI